jgi:hypothetical protein
VLLQGVPWVQDMLHLVLLRGAGEDGSIPQILFWDDISMISSTAWLGFEAVLHFQTRFACFLCTGQWGPLSVARHVCERHLHGRGLYQGPLKLPQISLPCRYTHPRGSAGLTTPGMAAQLRDAAYRSAGIRQRGSGWEKHTPKPVITYLMPANSEAVSS